ncbi:MAG TPA: XRE family transcriptional regulator [Burkholderiaceae bacterium]|nr:XRE family transcriptional regulator [Burkholderiaceae bacterium]
MAFNSEIFKWARESAGLELVDAARAISIAPASLEAIEKGQKEPSRNTLLNMSKAYRRSLLTFYLPRPPRKGDRGEDFRTVVAERTRQADAAVDALVRDIRARQNLVRAVLEDEEDIQPLSFIGSASVNDGVLALTKIIENTLGITHQQYRDQKNPERAFALLRDKVEKAGVFVLLIGNLGSHHSTIPVEAFRGLAVADSIAPFIVINDSDAKTAWSFTLLHELAHLWLGATGVSGGATSETKIERFCNDVASEFLLPREYVETIEIGGLDRDAQIQTISSFANRWHLSRQMVAYSLYKTGRISLDAWRMLDRTIRERWAAERRREKDRLKEEGGGPTYYTVRRQRLGPAILEFARHYINNGILSPTKAARVLGVKPRNVYPLLASSPLAN